MFYTRTLTTMKQFRGSKRRCVQRHHASYSDTSKIEFLYRPRDSMRCRAKFQRDCEETDNLRLEVMKLDKKLFKCF